MTKRVETTLDLSKGESYLQLQDEVAKAAITRAALEHITQFGDLGDQGVDAWNLTFGLSWLALDTLEEVSTRIGRF